MSNYTHTLRGQDAEAVAKLPDLATAEVEIQRATGTDGRDVTMSSDLALRLARLGPTVCNQEQRSTGDTPTGAMEDPDSTTPGRIRTCGLRIGNPLVCTYTPSDQWLTRRFLRKNGVHNRLAGGATGE